MSGDNRGSIGADDPTIVRVARVSTTHVERPLQLGRLASQGIVEVQFPMEEQHNSAPHVVDVIVPQQPIQPEIVDPRDQPAIGEFYIVAMGRRCGIFMSWEEAGPLVNGYPYNQHMKFSNLVAIEQFYLEHYCRMKSEEHRAILCRTME